MSDPQFCGECGSKLESEAQFCGNCGARVSNKPSPETANISTSINTRSSDVDATIAAGSAQPTKSRIGLPLVLIGGGGVLAILAILFSGILSPDTTNGKAVAQNPAVEKAPGNETQLSTQADKEPETIVRDLAWKTYVNSRYGVTVDYPSVLFAAIEPAEDNSGRGFEAADGSRFHVYSSANALEKPLDELMTDALGDASDSTVINQTRSADGFTLTIKRDEKIVHRHLMTSEATTMLHWLEIAYPETAKAQYATIAERMLASFQTTSDGTPDQPEAVEQQLPSTNVIDIALTGWTYNPAAKDFADLPALVPEAEYAADNQMGFLAFTCQPGEVSPAYFALLVAPGFDTEQEDNDVRLGAEGSGASGQLRLAMQDLYATSGGERPQIDWDATILFAPIGMEDLGQLIQAQALLVKAGGQTWRLASGGNLERAGQRFLTACETGDASTGIITSGEQGPDEFSYQRIASAKLGFTVDNSTGPTGFTVDIPDGWIRVPNTMDHELIYASPTDDFDAQMFLAILAKPSEGQSLTVALDNQLSILREMTDTETLENTGMTVNSGPAKRARIRFLGPSDDQVMLVVDTTVLQRGDITYVIEMTVPEPIWHTGQQVIEQALKTLKFD